MYGRAWWRKWCGSLVILGVSWGLADLARTDELKQPATAAAATPVEESPYIRVVRVDDEPIALQTSIIRYVRPQQNPGKFHVDLVGAVHVGDKGYYDRLNREFEKYDVVLYELVAPEGTQVPKGGVRSDHPVGKAQDGLKDLLGLEHQLSSVDYQKKNFVHADMTPEQMAESMEKRKESVWQMIWRAAGYSIARQTAQDPAGLNSMSLFGAMISRDGPAMKRAMASQFEDIETATGMFNGPDGSTILTERNKVAIEVLHKQLAAGKKKVAIFYGAAHLPDFDERLKKELQLERQKVEWITAWDLRDTKAKDR